MLAICGFTTSVAGAAMSSFLGMAIPGITPVINPMEDVMQLLVFAFGCGVVHIFAGMGIKAYGSIKEGKPLDALFDVFFWYIFVSGICMVVLPVIMPEFSSIADLGLKITGVGAVLLVLTQGRNKPGIFGKIFGGVSSLYGVINYFSDILSYSRIMALCLTTAVISQVVNILGGLIGSVPAIIIGIIGHTLNFLINALGTYVHTSRLHYVEFFGRFYEGGGTQFKPFKEKTKYTVINNNN
jgi:V/A-type H+-transporting ATPase subunit I